MAEEILLLDQNAAGGDELTTLVVPTIDVIVWGASRPHLLRRTLDSFNAHTKFAGRLRFFLEDGCFDTVRATESAHIAASLGFENINIEHIGSYGWAMTHAMNRWWRASLMFSLEDDWLCKRDIDLDLAWDLFQQHPHVNQLRFNRRKNMRDQNEGVHVYAQRTLTVNGQPLPFLSSPHWMFNPALWRRSFIWPRWRGYWGNVHLHLNGPGGGLLPPGERPSPDWYADTLGVLTWGGVGERAFFEHLGIGAESVHKAQGRV